MSVLSSKVQVLSGTSVASSPRVSRAAVRPQVIRTIQALAPRTTPRSTLFATSSQRQAVIVRVKPVPKGLGQAKWEEELEAGRDLSVNFDFDRWRGHESTWRYLRHTATLLVSRSWEKLFWPVVYVSSVAAAVAAGHAYLPSMPTLSQVPFSLTASVLSLLLVFRTNASYQRFDEARKAWGLIVNRTRDLNRQVATYFPPEKPESFIFRLVMQRWTVAFVRGLKVHLRSRGDLASELSDVLPEDELKALMDAPHRPMMAMQVLSDAIAASDTPTYLKTSMDQNLTAFEDAVGGCERILRTPLPLSYTRHTSRFLIMWLSLLPLSLVSTCGWATIPICAIMSFLMLGIEEIGVTIEEPFKTLALDAICGTIQTNMNCLVEDDNNESTPVSSKQIVMDSANWKPAMI